ncbi:site-2 protease family protein [bacterium]|nr:site-2 protease family protein [bacterium]
MTWVVGILAAVLSFGFIVFIHELGHFLAARWAGIRCPQFAIGFGPKLLAFEWRATEFSLRLLPVGGYVLMVGEDPQMDGAEGWREQFAAATGPLSLPTTPAAVLQNMQNDDPQVVSFLSSLPQDHVYQELGDLEGNFNSKSTWQKTIVIMGGVFMNYVSATLLLLGLGFSMGLCSGQPEHLARAKNVLPNTPAQRGGLKANENLISVDGVSVVSGGDFVRQMSGKVGQLVRITVEDKHGERRDIQVAPDLLLANHYVFSQGKGVELISLRDDSAPPSGFKLPFQVASVNGKAISELTELRSWSLNSKELTLKGPQGEWKIDSRQARTFAPRAIVGIELANITSFRFESKATSLVLDVRKDSQAARAGVQPGDILLDLQGVSVDSGQTQLEECLATLSQRQAAPDGSFGLVVLRNGKSKELFMEEVPEQTAEKWGVKLEPITPKVVLRATGTTMFNIMSIPYQIFKNLVDNAKATMKELGENSTGPIGIMQTIFEVSHSGFGVLLYVVALLNAFIATFNLLPFPGLDGSRLLFIWLGALRGRAIDPEKEARIHLLGLLLLLSVVFVVSIGDVQRLLAGNHLMK